MIRFLLLFILLFSSLSALSDKELLKRADGFIKSNNKSNQFRAYNDYKNLYLRSLMNNNPKMRFYSLKGIVKSGEKLHIDVSQYSKELFKLKRNKKPIIKKNQKLKVKSSHKLKSIRWKNSKLVLTFDKKLKNSQINYFSSFDSKKRVYKYIFDIHASMLIRSQNLRKNGVKRIAIAQHNTNTLRLVIENRSKLGIRFKKIDKDLIISIAVGKKNVSKVVTNTHKKVIPARLDRNKVIVIDPGHGGKDPGAIGYRKYREKMVVLQIATELRNILKARGYKVYMTRSRDNFVKLSKRTKYANRKKADIFISIHANAVDKKNANSVHGIECYFLSKSRSSRAKRVAAKENSADMSEMDFYGKSAFLNTLNSHNIIAANKLAIDLQRGALASLKKKYKHVKDAGVREGPFWVLVGAQMPSVLVEVGFITNPKEAKRLVNKKYQKTMALGLANGVERYFLNN